MPFLRQHNRCCNHNPLVENDGSWLSIVSLLFDVIAHRDQLALKRKALGRRKRKLARRRRAGRRNGPVLQKRIPRGNHQRCWPEEGMNTFVAIGAAAQAVVGNLAQCFEDGGSE